MLRGCTLFLAVGFLLLFSACGDDPPTEACGLDATPIAADAVSQGRGRAERSTGGLFDAVAAWSPAPSKSLTIGTLAIQLIGDEKGVLVDTLIADGAFPICVPLGERSTTQGLANFAEEGLVTTAQNTGKLVITDNTDGYLGGRFQINFGTLQFENGVFRASKKN
jgi:hypothetical protein